MDWKHLLWIVPVVIIMTLILANPSFTKEKPTQWKVTDGSGAVCNRYVQTTWGIDAYDCSDGKSHLDMTTIIGINYTYQGWTYKWFCQ